MRMPQAPVPQLAARIAAVSSRLAPAADAPFMSPRQVMLLRNIPLAGLALSFVVLQGFFALPAGAAPLLSVIGLLGLFNIAAAWRAQRSGHLGDGEVFGQVLADVAALTAFFYLAGGATNPFVDLFLVPLAIAALRLPWRHALYVGLLTLACYLLLAKLHVPLPAPRPGADSFLCVGMWLKYLLCGGFLAYVLYTIASRLRERERNLVQARQRIVNDDYLVRVGSLAAGAAHEIGSPLCTMAVLVHEMQQWHADRPDLARHLRLIGDQIEATRRIVAQLVKYGQDVLVDAARPIPVDAFLHEALERWRTLRPAVDLACRRQGTQPVPRIRADNGLGHAILNLLNNAADASPAAVEMECSWSETELRIAILDRGPGIPAHLFEVLGERFFTTKRDKGSGIGLLVAKTALQRAGGTLKLSNRRGGGACAELVVPVEAAHPAPGGAGASAQFEVRYTRASSRGAKRTRDTETQ